MRDDVFVPSLKFEIVGFRDLVLTFLCRSPEILFFWKINYSEMVNVLPFRSSADYSNALHLLQHLLISFLSIAFDFVRPSVLKVDFLLQQNFLYKKYAVPQLISSEECSAKMIVTPIVTINSPLSHFWLRSQLWFTCQLLFIGLILGVSNRTHLAVPSRADRITNGYVGHSWLSRTNYSLWYRNIVWCTNYVSVVVHSKLWRRYKNEKE